MRVIPLTSILSPKGRGSLDLDDTLSLDVKELFKHTLSCVGPLIQDSCIHINFPELLSW